MASTAPQESVLASSEYSNQVDSEDRIIIRLTKRHAEVEEFILSYQFRENKDWTYLAGFLDDLDAEEFIESISEENVAAGIRRAEDLNPGLQARGMRDRNWSISERDERNNFPCGFVDVGYSKEGDSQVLFNLFRIEGFFICDPIQVASEWREILQKEVLEGRI